MMDIEGYALKFFTKKKGVLMKKSRKIFAGIVLALVLV
jgi:hypothetical protein